MLTRICQLLRRQQNGTDISFDFSLCDTRGLRNYPRSTPKSKRNYTSKTNKNVHCSEGDCISTEGDCV